LISQSFKNLETEKWGNLKVDENGQTSIPGIFAGGDIATGAATVILAMGAGKRAARAIDKYVKTKK
jgi:glutamate synthase (NADPH) small chain